MPAFSKDKWPRDGAIRALLEYLDELHREAGQPSLRDMGDAIGLSPSTLSPFFTGTRLISKGNLELLAAHLGGDTARAERLRRRAATEWNDGRSGPRSTRSPDNRASVTSTTEVEHVTRSRGRGTPRQLPVPPRRLVGREAELRRLNESLRTGSREQEAVRIAMIAGMGGIGKTALAVYWAYQSMRSFPDGQLFVNLRGFDQARPPLSPFSVLQEFLRAMDVEPSAIPSDLESCAALYRSVLADREMIIVADNAYDYAQVAPLVPGATRSVILVTSRHRIDELRMHGAILVTLDVLDHPAAMRLLTEGIAAERPVEDDAPLDDLVSPCGGLPLAIEIVAGKAVAHPEFPLQWLAEELHETSARLDNLHVGQLHGNIRAVFSWSYATLPPTVASAFRLIGMAPGVTTEAVSAAALLGTTVNRAKDVLQHLESSSLIYQYRPNRYRMHDLVRLYAAERAALDEAPLSRDQAMRRIIDHYLFSGYAGDRLLAEHRRAIDLGPPSPGALPLSFPNDLAAVQWFDSEHSNILAAQRMAVEYGWLDQVWHFAWVLDSFHWRRGLLLDDIASWEAGLTAAQSAHDAFATGLAHRRLGRAYGRAARYETAIGHMSVGLSHAEEAGDLPGQAHARRILSWLCHQLADHRTALEHATSSIRMYEQLGNPVWTAHALDELGVCYMRLGQYDLAVDCSSRALAMHREHQHVAGVAESLDSLGNTMAAMGDYASAVSHYHEALTLYRTLDNTYDEANVFEHLGSAYSHLGQEDQADQAWREALALYQLSHRVTDAERITDFLSDIR